MRHQCSLLLVLVSFLLTSNLQAQDSVRNTDLYRFGDGAVYTLSGPARWKGRDWVNVAGVVAITAATSLLDEPLRRSGSAQRNHFLDGAEQVGFQYGKPYTAAAITGSLYLTGLLFHHEHLRETGVIMGTVLATGGLLQTILKTGIGRARPSTNDGHLIFDPLNRSGDYHSFPSGHAWMATTAAFVVMRRTSSLPVKMLAVSMAGVTMFARIYADAHWVSDLAFSTALAWFCTQTVSKRFSENRYRQVRHVVQVVPRPGGCALTMRF